MSPLIRCLCALLVLCPGFASCLAQTFEKIPLDSGWEFRQHVEGAQGAWLPAQVPGDVHLDLLRNKKIDSPFFQDNEHKLQWIENASWDYRTTIHVSPQTLSHAHVELVFEGLDSACDVYLNGEKIASPDNMFREWRLDVKGKLKPGANELHIYFPPPLVAAAQVAANDPWQPKIGTEIKAYVRKAVYEFGWDWGPRFATSGVWRPASLQTWDDARVKDVWVEQKDIAPADAHLDVQTNVDATHAGPAQLVMTYGLVDAAVTTVKQSVTLQPGENHFDMPVEIAHPSLWYPSGYGAQPIYRFHVQALVDSKVADERDAKTGLRKVVLVRNRDKWGRSFYFEVNGIPIFAKGADVIPFDSFPNRVTDANYKHILQSAKDANMNMVRLWGGGYYEKQEFYDLCDQLGLMVWHDLMFGNNWQPGTYDFKDQIKDEAEQQITRLRNHPSIVLWSGNNETELTRDWGGRGSLSAELRMRAWQDYLTEFSGILSNVATRLEPEIPYWPSSPSSDYEDTSDSFQSGDIHDWAVWHGNADFDEYAQHGWRFVSEYGFQSFPEMKTIEAFTKPADRTSIFTPVMLEHQKNSAGNQVIHDYMLRYFGEPKDFASFLYASQVLQAEGVKIGAEGFRRARPQTMGSIFWQLNDCWPVASWSSIDYYGRWKALQYYARRFYAPILISPHVEDGALAVYVVSDKTTPGTAQLQLRIQHLDGSVVRDISQTIEVKPLTSQSVLRIPLSELAGPGQLPVDLATVFASAKLTMDGKTVSQNVEYFVPWKQIALPPAHIDATLTQAGDGYDVKLESPVLARSTYVSFGDADVTFSDNYLDLLPGEPVTVHVSSSAGLGALRSQMKVMSLVDAFPRSSQQTAAAISH